MVCNMLARSLLFIALSFALGAPAHAAPPTLTLARVFADPPLAGRPPLDLALSPDGNVLAYLRPNEVDSEVLDLWGQRLGAEGPSQPERLVASADVLGARTQKLTEAERMALERRRITQRGITSFMWCGTSDAVLFPFSGDLYWARLGNVAARPPAAELAARQLELVRLTQDEAAPELAPSCSPKGRYVSYTKNGDMYVLEIATRKERKLSKGGGKLRSFGLAEFIAQEEMGRFAGHWWSPDETRLIVFEVDESPIGVKVRPQIFADRTELFEQRYPAAGEANARVVAHLFEVASGQSIVLKTPAADGYLPRAGFFDDGRPWVQWQSRDQKRLVLYELQDKAGLMRQLLEDTDPAWVELHDDLKSLADGRFIWSSERSGRRQLELVERSTGTRTTLTDEPEPVAYLAGVDAAKGLAYYAAYRERAKERHVFAVPLAGGAARPIAVESGWHAPEFAKSGTRFIDVFSSWGHPPKTSLREPGGAAATAVVMLDDNPTPELDAVAATTPEWRDFKAKDGTVLNGLLLPPLDYDATNGKRYPVIAWVYGGPTGQLVANRWTRHYPTLLHLSQRGFGVLMVDNRGTGGRGRDIDRAHYLRIGEVEVEDLFAAVAQLSSVAWVDLQRIGVWGWSYGGYLAARAVLDDKTPFAAAVAIAPVSDWTLYDTHYTERYLGLPATAARGDTARLPDGGKALPYVRSNLIPRAPLLRQPLLIMHGTADDNVLFEHSLRLIEALQQKSLPFETMIYPGKAHGISGRAAQLHVYETSFRFFERSLVPR